ncbi:hypothetical protein DIE15_01175 [Burkholderia sp. Bp9031]|nr:hypothetical protein DIE15_01175 [Burkholderia sp. Bp9031]
MATDSSGGRVRDDPEVSRNVRRISRRSSRISCGTRPLERRTRSAVGGENVGRRGTAPPPATDERREPRRPSGVPSRMRRPDRVDRSSVARPTVTA